MIKYVYVLRLWSFLYVSNLDNFHTAIAKLVEHDTQKLVSDPLSLGVE